MKSMQQNCSEFIVCYDNFWNFQILFFAAKLRKRLQDYKASPNNDPYNA